MFKSARPSVEMRPRAGVTVTPSGTLTAELAECSTWLICKAFYDERDREEVQQAAQPAREEDLVDVEDSVRGPAVDDLHSKPFSLNLSHAHCLHGCTKIYKNNVRGSSRTVPNLKLHVASALLYFTASLGILSRKE